MQHLWKNIKTFWESNMAAAESGVGITALIKSFGFLKLVTLSAALLGAGIMAIFRPPKSRKEVFLQGLVALGTSLLLGDFAVQWADSFFTFIDLSTASYVEAAKFSIAIHGLVGALSWGGFGALAHFRDKLSVSPKEALDDLKSIK